jgi:PAS domain S-box-containing protein
MQMTERERVEPPARILVVEDERIVARDLADTLGGLGYAVVGLAATGEQAISLYGTHRPDVVLMDIRLAGPMDGIEAATRIRAQHDVPVIYLTAHSDHDTLLRAKRSGPQGYLVKPFRSAELRCAIEIAIHRHEIDARLRRREQWLATTLRSIGDGVVATDTQQRVMMLNPVAEALTGWTNEEAVGRTLDDIMKVIDERGVTLPSQVGRALDQNTTTTLQDDARLVSRSGAEIPIADSAAPIVSEQGEVVGGVMVFREVSDQRRVDDDVRRLNAELETRVLERTAQLEAANKELEAFSYSVAHDLRAPLRGIDGFSQVLIEDHAANLGPEGLEQLRSVREATRRMSQLIDDMLRLGRAARSDLQRQRVDLSRAARQLLDGLRRGAPGRSVELVIRDSIQVDGDERLLRIALENLLANAWKFTSKTERARIELGAFDNDAAQVVFVRDNGAGFDMQRARKLFTAFHRLHAVNEFEGTGVGLAIVQRINHRHGGRIWAEASVGDGATFYFIL